MRKIYHSPLFHHRLSKFFWHALLERKKNVYNLPKTFFSVIKNEKGTSLILVLKMVQYSLTSFFFKFLLLIRHTSFSPWEPLTYTKLAWLPACVCLCVFDIYQFMSEQSSGVPYKSVNTDPLGNNRTLCFPSERAINRSTAYDSSSRDGRASTWCTNQHHNYHAHTGKPTHTLPHAVGPSFLTSLLYKWQFVVPACAFTFVCRPIKSDSVSTLVYRLFCSGTYFVCDVTLFTSSSTQTQEMVFGPNPLWQIFWNFVLLRKSLCYE